MQPVGIEPTSTALQTAAMTTSARVALGCLTSIDLVLPLSQSRVQATTLKTPSTGTANRNRTHIRRVEAYCIIHYTKARLVRLEGLEPSIPKAVDFKSTVYTIPPQSHYNRH